MIRRFASLAAMLTPTFVASAGLIDPSLEAVLRDAAPDARVQALVYLEDQVDVAALSNDLAVAKAVRRVRHEEVIRALQNLAGGTQAGLVDDLARTPNTVEIERRFWLVNAVEVTATPAALRLIATRPEVGRVYLDHPIGVVAPVENDPPPPPPAGGVEAGVVAVHAPEVWALGYTGVGVLIANIDTGVDGDHPALADRWAGLDEAYDGHPEWAWFDPHFGDNTFPYDDGGHGTHTMGTACGGAPGDEVGVAPGAKWIAAGAIDRPGADIPTTVANAIEAFQWMVDPDGNPATVWDVPAVCSNSWGVTTGHGYPECDETFWSFMDAAEAAGIIVIFAAGNEGTDGLRRPSDRASDDFNTFAVGAVDGNNPAFPIASFSSRGPTFCGPGGTSAIKPEVSAPGLNVRSSLPGGGYNTLSGTSMATPHVCGVVALMLEANPGLTSEQVKQILFDTAVDLGPAGEDNSYGHGIIDALAAVNAALSTVDLSFSFPDGRPELIDPAGGTTIRVVLSSQTSTPAGGSGVFYVGDGDTYEAIVMTEVGQDEYEAVFPVASCGDRLSYYFAGATVDGGNAYSPSAAPDVVYVADAYTDVEVVAIDDFELDMGWTVVNENVLDGAWERAVPAGGGDRGDPAVDFDRSGQCWLTDNEDGNSDVDGGPSRLLSPIFDLAGTPDAIVEYARWFTNDDQDGDRLVVEVSNDGGGTWHLIESVVHGSGWVLASHRIGDYAIPTTQMQFRFSVADDPNDSVTEAGLDAFRLWRQLCESGLTGDLDDDGDVDFTDLVTLLSIWGPCAACPEDLDQDGLIGFGDLLVLLSNWTG